MSQLHFFSLFYFFHKPLGITFSNPAYANEEMTAIDLNRLTSEEMIEDSVEKISLSSQNPSFNRISRSQPIENNLKDGAVSSNGPKENNKAGKQVMGRVNSPSEGDMEIGKTKEGMGFLDEPMHIMS